MAIRRVPGWFGDRRRGLRRFLAIDMHRVFHRAREERMTMFPQILPIGCAPVHLGVQPKLKTRRKRVYDRRWDEMEASRRCAPGLGACAPLCVMGARPRPSL